MFCEGYFPLEGVCHLLINATQGCSGPGQCVANASCVTSSNAQQCQCHRGFYTDQVTYLLIISICNEFYTTSLLHYDSNTIIQTYEF